MEHLECLFCQKAYPLNLFQPFCPVCQEPLLCHYPERKRNLHPEREASSEMFIEFLPLEKFDPELRLGEGQTPLVELHRIEKEFKLPPLFAKNESLNPTFSFKDRGTVMAVQKAVSLGIERMGTVSTGNMASSTAAYGAKAGLKTFVLVKEDISTEKLLAAAIHNPVLISVKGDYGELFYRSFALGRKFNIYFANSVDPLRIEGYKVIGYEIFLQLHHRAPDFVLVPVSSGGHLIGLMRSFLDLEKQGYISSMPTFIGIQAEGCSPIAEAFSSGKTHVLRIFKTKTIAHAISNPDPPGGNIVLKMIRESGGVILPVSDAEILNAQRILAEYEGLFCMPASATTLAGLLKLSAKMKLKPDAHIVLIITGGGMKAIKSLDSVKRNIHTCAITTLEEKIGKLLDT